MKHYLPGLNFLRIYAAICVIYVHATGETSPLFLSGWDAVTLFYVLSGYLITYKLLQERRERGAINLKAFYLRRELRILPLYYLGLFTATSLTILGAPPITLDGFLLAMVMLPQFAHALSNLTALGLAGHLYSIGVEEMFYFIFPWLMQIFSLKRLCITLILVSTLVSGLAYAGAGEQGWLLIGFMRFHCMAIGALAAWAVFTQSRWLRLVYHPAIQLVAILLIGAVIGFHLSLPIPDLTFSICVAILLLNVSTNDRSLLKLEWKWSKQLGNLTYGVYVWHLPIVWVLSQSIPEFWIFPASIVVSFIAAAFSYQLIERRFLSFQRPRASKLPRVAPSQ